MLGKITTIFMLFLASILACPGAFSQPLNRSLPAGGYRAIHWTEEQDFTTKLGAQFIKDAKGFLWIGSKNITGKLSRFDGAIFKTYIPDDLNRGNINSDYILGFEEDSLHNIWIGTDRGISRYDLVADSFANFAPLNVDGNTNSKSAPFWATRDEVYCMEPGPLISAFNVHTLKRRLVLKLSDDENEDISWHSNRIIFEASSNSIFKLRFYGQVDGHEYMKLDQVFMDGHKVAYDWPCYRPGVNHRHSAEDMMYDAGRNSIWINSGDGLLEFSIRDKQFRRVEALIPYTNQINFDRFVGIDRDNSGRIWFAVNLGGVMIYDPATGQLQQPLEDASLQKHVGDYVLRIYCDRDGIMWISYWMGKGIYQLLPFNPVAKLYKPDLGRKGALSNKHIASLSPGPGGKVWVGTSDGLNIFDPDTEHFEVLKEKDLNGLKGKFIAPLYVDSVKQMAWLKAGILTEIFQKDMRIYRMDLRTRKCRPVQFRIGSRLVNSPGLYLFMIKPFKGGLLVCEEHYGVFEIKENNLFAELIIPFDKPTPTYKVFLEEEQILYIMLGGNKSDPNRTYKNEDGKWRKIPHFLDSLEWEHILYDRNDGSRWIAFKYELVHFDRDYRRIRSYSLGDGYNGRVYNMFADKKGRIWFNNMMNKVCVLDTASRIISTLSEAQGFTHQSFGWGSSATSDANGNLYFGDQGYEIGLTLGLHRVYPDRFSTGISSSVYFRTLSINNIPIPSTIAANNLEQLLLKYNQNNIVLETGIIDYYGKGKGRVRYKLEREGKQEAWQYGPAYHTINYNGLVPGKYRLTMQATNYGNEFNSPEKILIIDIRPAFWQTWWFRIAALIFVSALAYFIIRWRIQQRFRLRLERSEKETQVAEMRQKTAELQQQATELEMQALRAQMNPHFIFNSLNSINRFILQNNRTQASEYLTKFSKLVRLILQNSQAHLISLESELESLQLYLDLEALRFDYRFGYKVSVPKDLDIEVLKVPPLIIQPYVENAIWHGLMHREDKGQLDIEVTEENEYLYFRIADNGIGRKQAAALASKSATRHKSMGLRITADRIAILQKSNGTGSPVTINDLVNEDGTAAGTEVIIRMPVIE